MRPFKFPLYSRNSMTRGTPETKMAAEVETEKHFLLNIKQNVVVLPNAKVISYILGENIMKRYVSACHILRLSANRQS